MCRVSGMPRHMIRDGNQRQGRGVMLTWGRVDRLDCDERETGRQ